MKKGYPVIALFLLVVLTACTPEDHKLFIDDLFKNNPVIDGLLSVQSRDNPNCIAEDCSSSFFPAGPESDLSTLREVTGVDATIMSFRTYATTRNLQCPLPGSQVILCTSHL